MHHVDETMQGLVADIFGAGEASTHHREEQEKNHSAVDPLMSLVKGILNQVADCAELVGVDCDRPV
jgi:hypothetical protein